MPDERERTEDDPLARREAADVARLLDFLKERDVKCPVCGYNVRDLTDPRCPECRQALELTVGAREVHVIPFVLTLAPSIFSAVAAALLSVPLFIAVALGNPVPPGFFLLLGFGYASTFAGFMLLRHRNRFLRAERSLQRHAVVGAWAIHILAFALLMAAVLLTA